VLVGRLTTIVSKLVPEVFKLTLPLISKLLIVSCLLSIAVCNPSVFAMVKSPSSMVG